MAKQMFLTGETTMYSLVVYERESCYDIRTREVFLTDDIEVAKAYKERFNGLVVEQHRRMKKLDEVDDPKCYDMLGGDIIYIGGDEPLESLECCIVEMTKRDIVLNKQL